MRNVVALQLVLSSYLMIGKIADLSEVWFLARVFERDLGQLPGSLTVWTSLSREDLP